MNLKQILFCLATLIPTFKGITQVSQSHFTVSVQDSLYIYQSKILVERLIFHPKSDVFYYWYKNNIINRTMGGYDGRLLDGYSDIFYRESGNLFTKGLFQKGLKVGIWFEWYPNGQVKVKSSWKQGKLNGISEEFDDSGRLLKRLNYKDNMLFGPYEIFNLDGTSDFRIQINGKEEKFSPNKNSWISRLYQRVFKKEKK